MEEEDNRTFWKLEGRLTSRPKKVKSQACKEESNPIYTTVPKDSSGIGSSRFCKKGGKFGAKTK